MIPYGRQDVTQADIDAVIEVLKSDFLTQGPVLPKFEGTLCSKVGSRYATAMNSATSALHLSCLALGLEKGGLLWTSPISFVASANCGLYCGAEVDFVDVDPRTYNMSVESLTEKLELAESRSTLPDVVVPVHMCGQSCEMGEIKKLSGRFGFKVIEDASHAVGAKYKNEAVGNCKNSDITVFSFHPVKIITSAEGGMALTNDESLMEKMSLLRSHGITRNPSEMTHEPDGPWYYQQTDLGYNYRMTDVQAALGLSQVSRLDEYVKRRNVLAERYDGLLAGFPLDTPWQHPDCYSSYHLYVIRLNLDAMGASHREVFEFMRKEGIGVNLHYIPIYTQPWYRNRTSIHGPFPEAEKYYREAITLPLFPKMTFEQQDAVIDALSRAVNQ